MLKSKMNGTRIMSNSARSKVSDRDSASPTSLRTSKYPSLNSPTACKASPLNSTTLNGRQVSRTIASIEDAWLPQVETPLEEISLLAVVEIVVALGLGLGLGFGLEEEPTHQAKTTNASTARTGLSKVAV